MGTLRAAAPLYPPGALRPRSSLLGHLLRPTSIPRPTLHTHHLTRIKRARYAMPCEVKDIKSFLLIAHRKDAKACRIKKSTRTTGKGLPTKVTKFKVRCSKYLYTLVLSDPEKAEKLRASLPPTLKVEDVDKEKSKKKA
ncbi:hypothetical protein MJO28_015389 [Puccinia striiformis f. sp. tritici]|uniref:Uncharacterized protein n=6 Tax=Puccinia striiformis TaxID=27350 RepID=A0A2S4V3M5_9BASI|nr:hypothetical protein MJO28_015368 [Puccinia striiformis f. sp. tritici]KAI9617864.1 hypothetical protein H4Q26_012728 [Puccinia striiformis f. sp. tritici PST-130]KNF02749.1 hypothetical protein PSTG_04034 [Puccinia striiformis f. sp. tritici PST-78]POV97562.1 hypothetical protein PSTT_14958 [Puccinia striiformis]KAI7938469.1 hypothetical protein MJO28_015389 [Puccinia striiformis f. sp. tritici]